MRIERINENQIRCTLTRHDLTSRDLDLSELAYGSEKARGLFHEMIEQASDEFGFEAEDIPLMVEAVPLSGDSLMLLITKIENPEELDVRFSKFSPLPDESGIADKLHFSGTLNALEEPGTSTEDEDSELSFRVFSFPDLDSVSNAALALGTNEPGSNSLYKSLNGNMYYLVVNNPLMENSPFHKLCNTLAEFSTRVPATYATIAYYEEHLDSIIEGNALQILANI